MDCKDAHESWDARVVSTVALGSRLPESGWRRMLAL